MFPSGRLSGWNECHQCACRGLGEVGREKERERERGREKNEGRDRKKDMMEEGRDSKIEGGERNREIA